MPGASGPTCGGHTPCRWPLVVVSALFTPLEVPAALAAGNEIEWRGQRLRLARGGGYEVLE
ncbi:MAG: hypothetical protein U0074_08875 [Kouleothrix sp.]